MGILVVGSVALDSVATPFGAREEILGGSATYFSVAASYFTKVSLVAVVGEDFPESHISLFREKDIDTSGLQRQKGRTFRWRGEYGYDLNTAKTLETQLNVFAEFSPKIQAAHRAAEYLFLGNIDPDLQRSVLEQMDRPKLVVCDTMNYWITSKLASLKKTLSLVDILIINDAETRQLADETNLFKAGRAILSWGPKSLVIKRGEYGAVMMSSKSIFGAPAFPLDEVFDPTGAGDSFAGGFVGYLAATGNLGDDALRRAIVFGSAMASFNVSDFGLKRLASLTYPEIEERFREFRRLTHFDDLQ
jgi:sugar/nucleoside kinase (ribokinase family)